MFQPTNLGKERLERWKREKLPKEPIGFDRTGVHLDVLPVLKHRDSSTYCGDILNPEAMRVMTPTGGEDKHGRGILETSLPLV